MKQIFKFLLLLAMVIPSNISAQNILMNRTYGGSNYDNNFRLMLKTNDGGYITATSSKSNDGDLTQNRGNYDFWIVKLDSDFNIQWQKSYGGSEYDTPRKIAIDSDGNYIIAGITKSSNGDVSGFHAGPDSFDGDVWVIKLNSLGNLLWQKCLGGSNGENIEEMTLLNDNSIMIFATTSSLDGNVHDSHGGKDYWVVKLNSSGGILWKKSYGSSQDDNLNSVITSSDGNFVLLGSSRGNDGDVSNNHGGADGWIVKINNIGDIIWQYSYGGSNYDDLYSIKQTLDNGYIAVGITYSSDGNLASNYGGNDIWIVKLSQTGIMEWNKNYGGSNQDNVQKSTKIQEVENGYVILGSTVSSDINISGHHGSSDGWIFKISQTGNLIWQRALGGSSYDFLYDIKQVNNNYILSGNTRSNDGDITGFHVGGQYSFGDYYDDIWIVKISSEGNLLWQKCLGGGNVDSSGKVLTDMTNGYLITGSTKSTNGDITYTHGVRDSWLIKLKLDYPILKKLDFYTQVTPNPSNPKNYLNQDLPIRFKVKVKNELSSNLGALTGTLTCNTAGVTISDNTVSFTAMQAGDETWSNDEFEITVDPSVANGTSLDFQLSMNDTFVSGGPWVSSFSFPIAPLQVGMVLLADNQGDNDGIPEPGEDNILTQPKINNVSNNTLEQVRGILTSEDTFLNITQNNYLYNVTNNIPDPINVGDVDVVPAFPYQFNYPSNEALQELNFNLELQANLDTANGALLKWQTTFSFNDGIEPPPSIVSTSPVDDATDVAVDGNLVVTFDKPVTAVTGKNIYIYNNGILENTIDVTDAQVSVSNEVVTINPTDDLQGGVDFYIIIENGAFVDNSSQAFSGINNPTTWNFTTLQNNPPASPVLTVNVLSDTEIELNWNTVTDADNYTILSCNGTTTYASVITSTTYTATNLTPSTIYDFIVKAENAAGLSPASNCETATTLCAVPWGSPVIYTTYTRALCEVTIDGQPAEEHDKVAAYVGSELRGIGDVFLSNGMAYAVVSIQGNAVETASFKIWDSSACAEVGVSYTTTTNPSGTIGSSPDYLPIAGSTADITDNILKEQIEIYPNPTSDILHIITTKDVKISNIQIFDLLGSLVFEVKQPKQDISLKKLSKGIYFMHVLSNKGDLVVKVVKK